MTDTLVPASKRVDRAAIRQYATITNDFNPIHVDPEFAAKSPMGGIIAHGMLSLNLVWQSIRATLGEKALEDAVMDIRFTRPVRENDTVTATGQRDPAYAGPGARYAVAVRNQKGEPVIQGTVEVHRA